MIKAKEFNYNGWKFEEGTNTLINKEFPNVSILINATLTEEEVAHLKLYLDTIILYIKLK